MARRAYAEIYAAQPASARRAEINQSLEPIHVVHEDLEAVVEGVVLLGLAPHQRRAGVVQHEMVAAEVVPGYKAERHRLDELDKEAVGAHIRDDGGKRCFLLLLEFALKKLEQLDLHALTLGFG